ncbi:MAG: hypothetical protein NT075_05880 [Chloroflexi bacterium]|nr:hypothetical protein [Chloroflexota bacterium]
MDKNLLRQYRERWEAVAEVERIEHQAATVEQRWRKFNSILRLAASLGLKRGESGDEIEMVRNRWKKLKGFS